MSPKPSKNPNEMRGSENELEGQVCPQCGMKNAEWPQSTGYEQKGETFCCEGCAEDTGCTCEEKAASDE